MNVFCNKCAAYGRLPIRSRTQIYLLRTLPNAISYSNTLARACSQLWWPRFLLNSRLAPERSPVTIKSVTIHPKNLFPNPKSHIPSPKPPLKITFRKSGDKSSYSPCCLPNYPPILDRHMSRKVWGGLSLNKSDADDRINGMWIE